MRKFICMLILAALVLTGCGKPEGPAPSAPVPEAAVAAETVPETAGERPTEVPETKEALLTEMALGFAEAWLAGDKDALSAYLAADCAQGAEFYEGDGAAAVLVGAQPSLRPDGSQIATVQFRETEDADWLQYLVLTFTEDGNGWKVLRYDLEA